MRDCIDPKTWVDHGVYANGWTYYIYLKLRTDYCQHAVNRGSFNYTISCE